MPVTPRHAGPISCAFWLQRVTLLSLVQPNDSCFPFLFVPLSISPCSLVRVGSRCAAFRPASRIEDQSLAGMILLTHRVEQAAPSPFWFRVYSCGLMRLLGTGRGEGTQTRCSGPFTSGP